mmetsp:Transcript_17734/g.34138  ORF Transcript_17734/g.34138 Transcript_17734/m.34138 type:complete len:93 (-) Transcript_17734:243-521(-)
MVHGGEHGAEHGDANGDCAVGLDITMAGVRKQVAPFVEIAGACSLMFGTVCEFDVKRPGSEWLRRCPKTGPKVMEDPPCTLASGIPSSGPSA